MRKLKRLNSQNGFQRFNIVSVPIYLFVFALFYASWKYLPVYWQREEMIQLCNEAILSSHRHGTDGIANTIVENALDILEVKVVWDDIEVNHYSNRYMVSLTYTVVVNHLFGYKDIRKIKIKTERGVIQ